MPNDTNRIAPKWSDFTFKTFRIRCIFWIKKLSLSTCNCTWFVVWTYLDLVISFSNYSNYFWSGFKCEFWFSFVIRMLENLAFVFEWDKWVGFCSDIRRVNTIKQKYFGRWCSHHYSTVKMIVKILKKNSFYFKQFFLDSITIKLHIL